MTDTIGYLNIFSAIFQIGLGLFAYSSDRKDKIKQYYFVSALFLGLWSLSLFFYSNPIFFSPAVWLKIVYTMAYCMTLGLILFATVYPKNNKKKFSWFFYSILVYMIVYSVFMWSTDLIIINVKNIPNGFNSIATMGTLYWLYWIPLIITAIYIVSYYIKQAKVFQGIEKRQVQFYVAGGIIMLFPVFLFDFILPMLSGNTSMYKYSTLGNSVWTIIVGYSILTTRFLDVRIFLGSIVITFLKTLLLSIYTLVSVYIIIPIWNIDLTTTGIIKLLIISILFTIILNKSFKFIEEKLLNKFVYVKYHPVNTLTYYASLNSKAVSNKEIIKNLSNIISESFNPDFSSVFLFDSTGTILEQDIFGNSNIKMEDLKPISRIWRNLNSNRILILSELEKSQLTGKKIIDQKINKIISFMSENKIEIVFSITEENSFEGIVMIGKKADRSTYTINDIDFLDGVIQNTHMALIRSSLYSQLEDFNFSLQQKVDEQTKELQQKIKELQEARRKEADMIDIMGHELRTPMSIVKLNADLLHNFRENIPTKKEEYIKYVSRIKNAVDTEIKLINTLLSSAKLEGNKIELNLEKVNIIDQIKMSIHAQEKRAKEKGIELITEYDKNSPFVYSDHARTVEILNNLIDNAVKYTKQGSVTVTTKDIGKYLEISVKDTGEGMTQEDISKLGQKFFRTGNYIKSQESDDFDIVRPGGTGLGLYVTFSLIKKMGGDIKVDSKLGEGSTFMFTLPKYEGQEIEKSYDTQDMFERMGLKQ